MTRRMLGPLHEDKLTKLMNTVIRTKLKVIPDSVTWGGIIYKSYTSMNIVCVHTVFNVTNTQCTNFLDKRNNRV